MQVRIANAPVSFGVFELADPALPPPDPDELLAALASQGYTGIDLGPVGWFGRGEELRDRLDRHGLDLAGGWVDMAFHDDDRYAADVPVLEDALDVFVAGQSADPEWRPKPTLAVSGTPEREAHPGGGATMPEIRLDDDGWRRFAANLSDALRRCRARGLEPTFHHHACTLVEAPEEIDRLLELTDVGLTLDTGHLILGGGDPLAALERWGERINHVHIKDVRMDLVRAAVARGAAMREVWEGRVFCRLGDGDLDLLEFVRRLRLEDYRGWVVVEQDVIPGPGDTLAGLLADQKHNLEVLESLGLTDSLAGAGEEPR